MRSHHELVGLASSLNTTSVADYRGHIERSEAEELVCLELGGLGACRLLGLHGEPECCRLAGEFEPLDRLSQHVAQAVLILDRTFDLPCDDLNRERSMR